MPKKTSNQEPTESTEQQEKRGRKPGPARQTLLDAVDGKETVLSFGSPDLAKGSAYGWWGARRRAGLTEKVSISLDTKAMTVTIGPRKPDEAGADQHDGGPTRTPRPCRPTPAESPTRVQKR